MQQNFSIMECIYLCKAHILSFLFCQNKFLAVVLVVLANRKMKQVMKTSKLSGAFFVQLLFCLFFIYSFFRGVLPGADKPQCIKMNWQLHTRKRHNYSYFFCTEKWEMLWNFITKICSLKERKKVELHECMGEWKKERAKICCTTIWTRSHIYTNCYGGNFN